MRDFTLVWTTLFIIFSCNLVNAVPVVIDSSENMITFDRFEYLSDGDGSINFDDIATGEYDSQFITLSDNNPFDPAKKAWWIRFSLKHIASLDNDWVFDFQHWSYVDFYFRKGDEKFQVRKTGHLLPYRERDLPIANNCYISINLEAQSDYDCIVRLDPEFNGLIRTVDLKFRAYKRPLIEAKTRKTMVISSFFVGIFVVMFLYNSFLYYTTREKVYRFYIVSILLLMFSLLHYSGFVLYVFSSVSYMPNITKVINYIEPQVQSLVFVLFVADFFQVKNRYPTWFRYLKIEIYFTVLIILLLLINYDLGIQFAVFNSLPVLLLVIPIAIKSLRAGYPSSGYFLVGHLFWLGGGIIAMLSKIGTIAQTDFGMQHSWALGSSMEMILFSIALGNRINALKQENEEKQKVVIGQLEENRKLQTKVNRELEQKVLERTREISEQNKEIINQRKTLVAEKNRSDRLLQNILPREIADELKQKGHATPRLYEQVSILFVDIKGFSMMVGDILPRDLVKDLDYCFTGFDYITTQHNLEKIKTIGDAYLCVGGLPTTNETHAYDVVSAAMEMLKFVEKWQLDNPVLGHDGLSLRIGINTGPVIAGVVGKKKFQFDIWGDAVNLASRMETAGEPGKINISNNTFELIKDKFACKHRGKINIKNMGEVDMYFVEGTNP